jgi:hypothetical protein
MEQLPMEQLPMKQLPMEQLPMEQLPMEQHTLNIVNNYHLNTNTYSYLETPGGQSSNLYLNVVDFFNNSVN